MSIDGDAKTRDEAGPSWRLDSLPRLGPRSLFVFTILWLAALALAVAAPIMSRYYQYQRLPAPGWGLVGMMVDNEDYRIIAAGSREARQSGISAGDRIIAVDGRPLAGMGYPSVRAWMARKGNHALTFTIRSGAKPPREVVLTRRPSHVDELMAGTGFTRRSEYLVNAAAQLLPAFLLVAASILLFRKRHDRVAALLSLSFLLIAATQFGTTFWQVHLPWLPNLLTALGWSGLALVLLVFPSGRFRPRWTRFASLLLLPWLIACGTHWSTQTMKNFSVAFFLGLGVAALAIRYRRLAPVIERQQLRWVFLGFAAGTACIIAITLILAASAALTASDPRMAVWLPILSNLVVGAAVAAFAGGLLVSMLGYRLYDVDTVISRSAGYAALSLGFVVVLAASKKAVELASEQYFQGDSGAISWTVATAVAGFLISPMHDRLLGWAESRFQKALLHLRNDLPSRIADLRETATLDELLDEVLARIETGTRAQSLAVAIDGRIVAERGPSGGAWLAEVPLTIGHRQEEIGALLVGPRPDGSKLGKDEQDALGEVADPIARAVKIVRLREARESATAKNAANLSRRISKLEKAMKQSPV